MASLTYLKLRSYSRLVRCRIIAAGFLGMWLVLMASDFLEDIGVFAYDDPAVDLALDSALADLGQAVNTSGHSDATASLAARDHFRTMPALLPASIFTSRIFQMALRETHSPPEPPTRQGEFSAVLLL